MERMKRWFNGGRKILGSMDNLSSNHTDAQRNPQKSEKTEYELTSMKIKYFLEKKHFRKVVDTLRDLPHSYILKCLQSFPFKALNRAVPESFPIWETLLTKLHNSEEGYIPQFPYAACDELVFQIAWLLEKSSDNPHKLNELVQSCKRVLKRVYMQYNEVLEHLYKEHDKVEHALYTLGLHLPLGTDVHTAISLQQAIKDEVKACMEDYTDAIERLDEVLQNEVLSLPEVLSENQQQQPLSAGSSEDEDDRGLTMKMGEFPLAPNPNQVQLQERLYQNQCVLTNLQPSRRGDNLLELLELLKERIRGDKEVLAIFGNVRRRNEDISDSEPVEPWLKKQQHAIECVIGTIKEIEKELEIKVRKSNSPVPIRSRTIDSQFSVPSSDDGPQIVPIARPRSISLELAERSPSVLRRHSANISGTYLMEEDTSPSSQGRSSRNHLVAPNPYRRPRSASPHKILRVGGDAPMRSGSSKSINSSNGSCTNLAVGTSSSVHDLQSTNKDNQPSLAFTRVQSLKTNQTVQVVAGKRKKFGFRIFPNSMHNLTSLNGSGNGGSKKSKKSGLYRTGSGGLGLPSDDRKLHGSNGMTANYFQLQQDLEYQSKELLHAREMIQELRRRERELTDRLSEQAQRHLQDSEKFEDILMGTSRPTLVIQRYQELYSQGRMEALDAIEGVQAVSADRDGGGGGSENTNGAFGIQLVLDVLKIAYNYTCLHLEKLHDDWRAILCVGTEDKPNIAVRQLESAIGLYLRRTCSKHDVLPVMEEVKAQLTKTYGHSNTYEEVFKTDTFQSYIQECCRLTWDLCIQSPPMEVRCCDTLFDDDRHVRFYESNKESSDILLHHWPTLFQSSSETVLYRGVVQT